MAITPKSNKDVNEQLFEHLQIVYDITSRIDERVKVLIESNKGFKEELDKVNESYQKIINRVLIIEEKDIKNIILDLISIKEKISQLQQAQQKNLEIADQLKDIQQKIKTRDGIWSKIFDGIWKLMLTFIAGYVLYKLGLQAPP